MARRHLSLAAVAVLALATVRVHALSTTDALCFGALPAPASNSHQHCVCAQLDAEQRLHFTCVQDVKSALLGSACMSACKQATPSGEALCQVYKVKDPNALDAVKPSKAYHFLSSSAKMCKQRVPSWAKLTDLSPAMTVHYIWWGNPAGRYGPIAKNGPNQMADSVLAHKKVWYWRQASSTAFDANGDAELSGNIRQVQIGVGGQYATPSAILEGTDMEQYMDVVDNVVGSFQHYGAVTYAGIKDLLALLVLYKHGGYFLDTSSSVKDEHVTSHVTEREMVPYKAPRLPVTTPFAELTFPQTVPSSHEAQWTGLNTMSRRSSADKLPGHTWQVRGIEVFAAWSPPGHAVYRTAIAAYLDRAAHLGLATGGAADNDAVKTPPLTWQPDNGPALTITDVMTYSGTGEHVKTLRGTVIGNLIGLSLMEGMAKFVENDDGVESTDLLQWDVAREGKSRLILPIHVLKTYQNSWRAAPAIGSAPVAVSGSGASGPAATGAASGPEGSNETPVIEDESASGVSIEDEDPSLVPAQGGPTLVEGGPTLVEGGPTLVEGGPTLVEGGPTLVEGGPTLVGDEGADLLQDNEN